MMQYVAFGVACLAVGGLANLCTEAPRSLSRASAIAEFQRWLMIIGFYSYTGLHVGGYL